MPKSKEADFLALFSKSKLNALKKKVLSDKNDACPINTINQLLQNSCSVPKQNSSLRSLRSKPSKPSAPSSNANIINEPNLVNLNSVSLTTDNSGGTMGVLQIVSNQNSNITGVNESVFVAPTKRAPRALKNEQPKELDDWLEEIKKNATLAMCILDKETTFQLFYILNAYIFQMIEDCAPGSSQNQLPYQMEVKSLLNDWINNKAFGDINQHMEHDQDFPDIENMTSVSGHPAQFQGAFGNQNFGPTDYQSSVVGERLPHFDRACNQSVSGSTCVGFGSIARPLPLPDNGPMLPRFMKVNKAASLVGSINQTYNYPYADLSVARPLPVMDNETMLPNFMKINRATSVVGSINQSYNYPLPDTTAYKYGGNSSVVGYPHRSYSSRSNASFACRPIREHQTHLTTMMNPNYPQINQTRLLRGNPLMHYNVNNMRQVPSVIAESNGLSCASENVENFYEANATDKTYQPRRKMLLPLQHIGNIDLQPSVVLNRAEADVADFQRQPNRPLPTAFNSKSVSSHYSLRSLNNSQMKQTNTLINNTPFKKPVMHIKRVEKTIVSTPPLKEVSLNRSLIVGVTRSGRTVRAPMNFWTSLNTSERATRQEIRGSKRKRV